MRGALREAAPGGATGPAATAPLLVADRPGPPEDGRRTGGHARARVVIGIHDLPFHQEVQDFLGRHPEIEVAASATDAERLGTFLREVEPDAAVVCPVLGRALGHRPGREAGAAMFLVAEELTVPVLRSAIEAGAQGAYRWPEERGELASVIPRVRRSRASSPRTRGRVVAVFGACGGAGVTFLATHLAASFADRGLRTALVDMDPAFSNLSAALGIGADEEPRTIGDLLPVVQELSPDHVDQALFRHGRGFGVLLASGPGDRPGSTVPPGLYSASVALLAGDHDAVVLHVGRSLEPVARSAIGLADRVLLVTGLDLLSLYGARRALAGFRAAGSPQRFVVVVNRCRRSELTATDAERILGVRPASVLRCDPAVGRAQDRGELLPARSRKVWRDVNALAETLVVPGEGKAGDEGRVT